jgi:AcrR family transcriptional regulator
VENRRAQIAAAAYELVAEQGIERLSLRAVARRVGATTGLVSHHFVDRRDLLAAALDHAVAVMVDRMRAQPDHAGAFDHLAAVLPTDERTMEVWRFSLSVRAAGLFDDDLQQFDRAIRAYWEEHLPDRLADVPAAERVAAARHLVAVVDGIALNAALDPAGWPAQRQIAHLRAGFAALTTGAGHLTGATTTTTGTTR